VTRATSRRFGMVGAGLASAPWLDAVEAVTGTVAAVVSSHPARIATVRQRFADVVVCRSPEEALEEGIDVLLVLSPPSAHEEAIRAAVAAGVPVIVEKPLERDLPRARALVDLAAAAGVPLAVCHQYRFQEGSRALHDLLAEGTLGRVLAATLDVAWWRADSYYAEAGRGTYERDGGGVLITQAIHALDVLVWCLGLPVRVQATLAHGAFHPIESEDLAAAILHFADGSFATLFATTGAAIPTETTLRVLGTRGMAVLVGNRLEVRDRDGNPRDRAGDVATTISPSDPMAFPSRWHAALLADTLAAFDQRLEPPISGAASLDALALIAAVERSARDGGRATAVTVGADDEKEAPHGR
jgi:UDP-N-acetyl-2-amino-2-deoxyglucuronate dehydrogenase